MGREWELTSLTSVGAIAAPGDSCVAYSAPRYGLWPRLSSLDLPPSGQGFVLFDHGSPSSGHLRARPFQRYQYLSFVESWLPQPPRIAQLSRVPDQHHGRTPWDSALPTRWLGVGTATLPRCLVHPIGRAFFISTKRPSGNISLHTALTTSRRPPARRGLIACDFLTTSGKLRSQDETSRTA